MAADAPCNGFFSSLSFIEIFIECCADTPVKASSSIPVNSIYFIVIIMIIKNCLLSDSYAKQFVEAGKNDWGNLILKRKNCLHTQIRNKTPKALFPNSSG